MNKPTDKPEISTEDLIKDFKAVTCLIGMNGRVADRLQQQANRLKPMAGIDDVEAWMDEVAVKLLAIYSLTQTGDVARIAMDGLNLFPQKGPTND